MPRFRASAISALIALLGLALPGEAASAPIVFDFEDGLQGWELGGAATRVQTQVLGGEWAIFGDGLLFELKASIALISMEADLTEVLTVSVDQLLLLDMDRSAVRLATVRRTDGVISGLPALPDPAEPGANPGTWVFDVSQLLGHHEIAVWWNPVICRPQPCTVNPATAASFIDNITFHPVPEPSSLVLLAFSLGAVLIARRRIG